MDTELYTISALMKQLIGLLWMTFCLGDIAPHLKQIQPPEQARFVEGVDFIYVINLDLRPEKMETVLHELAPYGIIPYRFSAIYGWSLPPEVLSDLGLKYSGAPKVKWANTVVRDQFDGSKSRFELTYLTDDYLGETYFAPWITLGAVGCSLSHLSILKDAYEKEYETIWIMEDDIHVVKDPHLLATLIRKLDLLVGEDGWDVLYTDLDTMDQDIYSELNNFETDLKGDLYFVWRPDLTNYDQTYYRRRKIISPDFIRIGSRMRTHSMILRRSGIKKIFDFETQNGIYTPYDHEVALVPGIRLYSLRYPVVTVVESISDTRNYNTRTFR